MLSPWIIRQLVLIGIFRACYAVYRGQSVSLIDRNEFTYVVEIVDSTHADDIHCGGAIIDETHILTAAHCVFYSLKEKITIHAGEVHRGSVWGKVSSVARIHVTKKFRDHEYRCGIWARIRGWVRDAWDHIKDEANCYLFQDDVAVLTLSEALPFNENITAVNLPDYDLLPHCQLCIFPGWGQTEKDGGPSQNLQWIYLMISETPRNRMKFSRAFWAIDPMLKTCPLMGDSGAPLVFNNTVYGVHSAGNRDPSIPSIFCKVFAHINFIREALKN